MNVRMWKTMIYIYISLALTVLLIALSRFIAKQVFRPKTWGYQETYDYELKNKCFDDEYLSTVTIENVFIDNDALRLHGQWINQNSDKTIIIMHGHTYTSYGSYKYSTLFLKAGYNVLMPDQRYHGLSDGRNTTLGYKEANDLHEWIQFVKDTVESSRIIGLHGESMGGATVLLAGHNEAVNFVISDCSFSDLKRQIQDVLKRSFKIPRFFIYPVALISRLLYNAPLLKVSPIKNIPSIKAPILYIHGDLDSYVNIEHFNRLIQGKKSIDHSYLCTGANHAQSYTTNKELYESAVTKFLDQEVGQ